MAAKAIMLKLIQEMHGYAEVTNRCPPPRPTGLTLIELRSSLTHTRLPPRRQSIAIEAPDLADVPHPVKITHLAASPSEAVRGVPSRPA